MNLTSGEAFNTYDIHLSYNYTAYRSTVLNVTGEKSAPGSEQFFRCINGVGSGCDLNDTTGVVHSAADFPNTVYGPQTSVLLFTINFTVIGKGVNLFHPFKDLIINPDPVQGAHPILHATYDGIYSNAGITAFFNTTPAILIVHQNATFDGTGSFDPSGTTIMSYSWNFGDSGTAQGAVVKHSYTQTGNYSVTLTVSDSKGMGSLSKTIPIVSGLGGIRVVMLQSNGKVDHSVTASLYNGTVFVKNVTRPAYVQGAATFQGLTPGNYHVIFSGPGVVTNSTDLTVIAGWTTWYTIYVNVIPAPVPSPGTDIRFFLAIGAVAAGIALGSALLLRVRLGKRKR